MVVDLFVATRTNQIPSDRLITLAEARVVRLSEGIRFVCRQKWTCELNIHLFILKNLSIFPYIITL